MDNFKEHISRNRAKMDIEFPSPHLLDSILKEVENKKKSSEVKNLGWSIGRMVSSIAAVFLLLLTIVFVFNKNEKVEKNHAVLKEENPAYKPQFVEKPLENFDRKEGLVLLIDRDLNDSKQHTFKRLNTAFNKNNFYQNAYDQSSSATRFVAMKLPANIQKVDIEILKVLVYTLNNDPSTNVRMAALESLSKFTNESYVKKSLIESLRKQNDPVIQINMINILAEARVQSIEEELNVMYQDEKLDAMIKHEILLAKQRYSL